MSANIGFDKCFAFINCQLVPQLRSWSDSDTPTYRAVTLSRQTGSGGHALAEALAEHLQETLPNHTCAWTVFDRNLVEKVLEDHHLPARLAKFMPEDRVSGMTDTLDELFGLHPPSSTLARQTAETILRLCDLGNVILLGRGAAVITAKLPYVFHVRLVGSVDRRAQFLQEQDKLTRRAALERIRTEDLGRARYMKKHYGANIDDPLLYHLVLNTDRLSRTSAARLIGEAMRLGPSMPTSVPSREAAVQL